MEENTQRATRISDVIIHIGSSPMICDLHFFVCNPSVYTGIEDFMPILTGQ